MDGFSFTNRPPKAVTDFFDNKELVPSFSWEDIWAQEHAFAFTVAKATELNVLNDIFEEMQSAIAQGRSFSEFKKSLTPKLKARGWWGEKDVVDPQTGKTVRARLGSPRRLRTIYWANIRTARAAGQWQRIQNTTSVLPYLSYELGPSEIHRPLHASKQGIILPASDPFWAQWFAPNGWGCQCWHRQISAREAQRRGISQTPKIRNVTHRNMRTGEITSVPEGIDPGWNSNPGLAREDNMRRFLAQALERSPASLAQIAISDLLGDSEFTAHMRGERLTAWPMAVINDELATLMDSKSRTIFFSQDSAARHNDLIKDKDYPPPQDFAFLQEWLPRAAIYLRAPQSSGPRVFTAVFTANNGLTYWAGIKVTRKGELFLTTFFSKGRNLRGSLPNGDLIKAAQN